jgi:hypothetical protein
VFTHPPPPRHCGCQPSSTCVLFFHARREFTAQCSSSCDLLREPISIKGTNSFDEAAIRPWPSPVLGVMSPPSRGSTIYRGRRTPRKTAGNCSVQARPVVSASPSVMPTESKTGVHPSSFREVNGRRPLMRGDEDVEIVHGDGGLRHGSIAAPARDP